MSYEVTWKKDNEYKVHIYFALMAHYWPAFNKLKAQLHITSPLKSKEEHTNGNNDPYVLLPTE